jgi:hypothetical protein
MVRLWRDEAGNRPGLAERNEILRRVVSGLDSTAAPGAYILDIAYSRFMRRGAIP